MNWSQPLFSPSRSFLRVVGWYCLVLIVTGFSEPTPFWKGKRDLLEKIESDREILVSVRTEDVKLADSKPGIRFVFRGVGRVRRDRKSVVDLAMRFQDLKTISDHFKEVKWDPVTSRLFVIGTALGYQARMLMKIEKTMAVSPQRDEIRFKVIEGHFLGLEGAFVMETTGQAETELSIWCLQDSTELPMPRFLAGFALEVVAKNVANKMRTHFETATLDKVQQ